LEATNAYYSAPPQAPKPSLTSNPVNSDHLARSENQTKTSFLLNQRNAWTLSFLCGLGG
jgi:hypothetical protein